MGIVAAVASCVVYLMGAGATYEIDPGRMSREGEVARGLSRAWIAGFWLFYWTAIAAGSAVSAPFNLGRRLARGTTVPVARALPPMIHDEEQP